MLRALRHFLKFCIAAGLIDHDPARALPAQKMKNTGGFYTWTEDDVAEVRSAAPGRLDGAARRSSSTSIWGCANPTWCGSVRAISGTASLTDFLPQEDQRTGGNRITVPLLEDTEGVDRATPVTGTDTFLVTSFGKAFTANGFGNKMRRVVRRSRIAGLHAATVCAS